jgi:hypothetical protein
VKKLIRRWICGLKVKTDTWVIPSSFWVLLEEEKLDEARLVLEAARKEWPDDPEISYASGLLHFLD